MYRVSSVTISPPHFRLNCRGVNWSKRNRNWEAVHHHRAHPEIREEHFSPTGGKVWQRYAPPPPSPYLASLHRLGATCICRRTGYSRPAVAVGVAVVCPR